MLSRSIARAVPRTISRAAPLTLRPQLFAAQRATLFRPVFKQLSTPRFTAAFSTTRTQRDINEELSARLESEIALEKESTDEPSTTIKEFLENTDFSIQDTPGQEDVVLTKQYNDEKIKVTFTIRDLNNMEQDEEDDYESDNALFDEDEASVPTDTQSGGASTKGAVNQGRTSGGNVRVAPEDNVAPADREELQSDDPSADEPQPSFPAAVNVIVERPGKGALLIETIAEHGEIVIENVYHFPSAELADAKSAEKDWERRSLYTGPPFGNLDEELQTLMERYLDERGINTSLALFVPDYIDFKEQREYLNWLANLKNFVE